MNYVGVQIIKFSSYGGSNVRMNVPKTNINFTNCKN